MITGQVLWQLLLTAIAIERSLVEIFFFVAVHVREIGWVWTLLNWHSSAAQSRSDTLHRFLSFFIWKGITF